MSTKDFYRLRIGIGHPGDRNKVVNYVLKSPGKVESQLLEEVIGDIINEVPAICRGEYQSVMQHLHGK
jgi:PTH1 family peptidyl-tRNA hydrolase